MNASKSNDFFKEMGQKRAKTIPFLVFLTQIAIGIAPANLHLESAHGAMVVVH
ncbi:hypothetical protein [Segatella baroniae]|uniref:hypothetical protein n=1 Tax=Segatella baroniae TaxID=305719 RepID=UPI0004259E02|nr:hypothetical protein [Segatella baroniae]